MGSVFLIFVCALVLLGAVTDVRTLKIPNMIPVFILISFAAVAIFDPTYLVNFEGRLISAAMLFVVTFIMFALNLLGAGDSKLLAVLGFWLPFSKLWPFIFVMALSGAVLGVAALMVRKVQPGFIRFSDESWGGQLQKGRSAVPYAVAIAIAFYATVFPWG